MLHYFRHDLKREGPRKRTASGNRPISTCDGFDPFDSLGVERAIDGQVKIHLINQKVS